VESTVQDTKNRKNGKSCDHNVGIALETKMMSRSSDACISKAAYSRNRIPTRLSLQTGLSKLIRTSGKAGEGGPVPQRRYQIRAY
jgi:hypothetical protein